MTRVKICGITNLQDARAAAGAGADLLGFIFYPPSPRCIPPDSARDIIRTMHHVHGVQAVGVFVNEPIERIREMIKHCELDYVQLSGDEPAWLLRALSPRAFKALRPRDPSGAARLLECYGRAAQDNLPAFLIDAYSPNRFGGTGERADWQQAREVADQFPVLLAGGLTPENVAKAVEAVRPWGVDVSSGVERAPGVKDHEKVRQFIVRAKGDSA